MNRTRVTGLLLSMLGASVGCGDEDFVCQLDVCGTGCVNLQADNDNCGACFNECGTGTACQSGTCEPTELVCEDPTPNVCDEECVDVMSDAAHCGSCDNTCSQFSDCLDGSCAGPLVALRTVIQSKGDILRDVFVVDDTLEITRLGNDAALGFSDRVLDYKVMPDGHVLLVAAEETEGVFELWLSSPKGGALTKLSAPLSKGAQVIEGLAVSADSSKVLYRVSGGGGVELVVVSVAAPGVATKINGASIDGGGPSRVFALNGDGSTAFYLSNEQDNTETELFSVDLSGATPGAPVQLNPPLDIGNVFDFVLSPDGTRLVYRAQHDDTFAPDLFYVDLTTGTAHEILNSNLVGNYEAGEDYQFTADQTSVVYRATDNFADDSLFIAALEGPTFDSALLAENVDGNSGGIRTRVALTGDAAYFIKDITFGDARLFKAAFATPNTIVPVFDGEALTVNVDHVAVSPDGTQLVFGAGGDGGEFGNTNAGIDFDNEFFGFSTELYYVDLSTATLPATPIKVVDLVTAEGSVEGDYFVKNDGRIVVRGVFDTTNRFLDTGIAHPSAPLTIVKIGPDLGLEATDADAVRQIRRF